jgi:hypothetical protein
MTVAPNLCCPRNGKQAPMSAPSYWPLQCRLALREGAKEVLQPGDRPQATAGRVAGRTAGRRLCS